MRPRCPLCGGGATHAGFTMALDRFSPDGPSGYRATFDGAPVRPTRAEAEADYCAHARDREPTPITPLAVPRAPEPQPVAPKPAGVPVGEATAVIERLARERAWSRFLAEATQSLMVWGLDEQVRAELDHPLVWMRACAADLTHLARQRATQGALL